MKFAVVFVAFAPLLAHAQGTAADYQRSKALADRYHDLAINIPGPVNWIGTSTRFWYRKSVKGGGEFVVVDASTLVKGPAFDHEKLAASLSKAAGKQYLPARLPFEEITFLDNETAISFITEGFAWRCTLDYYNCRKTGPAPQGFGRGGGRGAPAPEELEPPSEPGNDVADGMVLTYPQQAQGGGGRGNSFQPFAPPVPPEVRTSPDEKWEAFINNYNVCLRKKGETKQETLSFDGSEGNYYTLVSLAWSPDSKHLAAYRVHQGYRREVHYVESSPADQLQPKHSSRDYAKPGDTVDIAQPVLFQIEPRQQVDIENTLFPNPYALTRPVWWKDSRGFTFEYNQRGHQVYRVVEVDAATGKARALINETSPTFIDYSGKKIRHDVADGTEIVWASEREGWQHLYLYDGHSGALKNQITKGNWVVRAVEKVDEEKRQIWFAASGMYPGKDPYLTHWYRINFDGTGMVALTDADGNHSIRFSPDMQYYVDTWSRVDLATVSQLRRTADRKPLMDLEHGDVSALVAAGWRAPEVFSTTGRDGKTGIWGIIVKPTNFDPAKRYPVVENIYAGPQGSFVPKSFAVANQNMQTLAELGFIVVQIDGMGTNNRSKAFHDVAWKNLGDAGFPDRILWHKAVAAKYPWYDISRVGIYGTSAGGQNSMGAVLFHPEFYKVAVSNSGCHDNRMDKIWWNEQWMGWPVGPQYAAASNVENASKLQGKLLLVVGELDTNVDPSSTFQVVNALIKANKKFDLLYVPGGGHGAGGAYYQHLLQDFFVHHLIGVEPPDWNGAQRPGELANGPVGF
jgi:dipeptidyl aminopeptidase/acylaminoacyl peptidase